MEIDSLDIYFWDLTPVAQQEFLKCAGLSDAKEGNYDVLPLFTLYFET